MKNRNVESVSTEAQGKIFPWLVVLLLIREGKILLKQIKTTGRYTLPKEFGGTVGGLEFSYKETIGRILQKHNIVTSKALVDEITDIKDSYRKDLIGYFKKIFVRAETADAVITCLDEHEPVGWFFPSDVFFLKVSDEDKRLIVEEFGLDKKRFSKAAAV